jgi:glyoxylase-like metal-dependent hydrolase (beta-lactamase superfamily II)
MRGALLLFASVACSVAAAAPLPVAPGIVLLPGAFVPGSQPDGNTLVWDLKDGLLVMDTGRHRAHTQQIVDFAQAKGKPVRTIVNSHWHLDHIGGNIVLRTRYPQVHVIASDALEGALGGFLANYRRQLTGALEQKDIAPQQANQYRGEIALIDGHATLGPDEVLQHAQTRHFGGRQLELHLERQAVTEGDVWIFDRQAGVLAAGDLVTLPVPFLDTACAPQWQAALGRLAALDFKRLVPGHGAVMDKEAFVTYRKAFDHLLACGASGKDKGVCVDGWMDDAAGLLAQDEPKFVRSLVDYYVEARLRGPEAGKYCAQ